jgi:hypothetical protein
MAYVRRVSMHVRGSALTPALACPSVLFRQFSPRKILPENTIVKSSLSPTGPKVASAGS